MTTTSPTNKVSFIHSVPADKYLPTTKVFALGMQWFYDFWKSSNIKALRHIKLTHFQKK